MSFSSTVLSPQALVTATSSTASYVWNISQTDFSITMILVHSRSHVCMILCLKWVCPPPTVFSLVTILKNQRYFVKVGFLSCIRIRGRFCLFHFTLFYFYIIPFQIKGHVNVSRQGAADNICKYYLYFSIHIGILQYMVLCMSRIIMNDH